MTCKISFGVDEETAEEIIESIDDAVNSSDESWTFQGDFTIPQALEIKKDLQEQLNDGN